jgi:hypothetical protein
VKNAAALQMGRINVEKRRIQMMAQDPLLGLEETIEAHWRQHLPQMTARLAEKGELEQAIAQAARTTTEAVLDMERGGMSRWEAWMAVRQEWAILPAEETEAE